LPGVDEPVSAGIPRAHDAPVPPSKVLPYQFARYPAHYFKYSFLETLEIHLPFCYLFHKHASSFDVGLINYILFEFGVFGKRLPASSLPFLHGRRRVAAMQAARWRVGRGAGLRSVASVDWPPRRGGGLWK
jgi:hypothetical protein